MKQSRKIKRVREDQLTKTVREIGIPLAQRIPGAFKLCGAPNPTAGQNTTVRRLTRVEQLQKAGEITADQAVACAWYAEVHELGFQTIGCTANYGGPGGGGFGSSDLLARYKAQGEARENYLYARSAIPAHLLSTFEAMVLGTGRPVHMTPKAERLRFSLAAHLLHGQIGHLLAIAA